MMDVVVVTFADPHRADLSRVLSEALEHCGAAIVPAPVDWGAGSSRDVWEPLAGRLGDASVVLTAGLGLGGFGALSFAQAFGAQAVLALAPMLDYGRLIAPQDVDDLVQIFANPTAMTPSLSLLASPSSAALDMALAERLVLHDARLTLSYSSLPLEALPVALYESGQISAFLATQAAGPQTHSFLEVSTQWLAASNYKFDLEGSRGPAQDGALMLTGRIVHQGDRPLEDFLSLPRRLGARIYGYQGQLLRMVHGHSLHEDRQVDGAMRFSLPFSGSDLDGAETVICSVVCGDGLWLDTMGFAAARFMVEAYPSRARPGAAHEG